MFTSYLNEHSTCFERDTRFLYVYRNFLSTSSRLVNYLCLKDPHITCWSLTHRTRGCG